MLGSLGYLPETPSQTAGPYVHIGLLPETAGLANVVKSFSHSLLVEGLLGERISVEGRVLDGSGTPLRDVLLEIWQADASGRYPGVAPRDDAFRGWGRAASDFQTGLFRFETIKPGSALDRQGRPMAPHINFWLVARGINIGLSTRMYFADEASKNDVDPVLSQIEQDVRRRTLVAARSVRDGAVVYSFDIRLQGEAETVFFDI
jgi:protocatechuate 3,4-dioxygenase alpha subunit